MTLGVTRRDFLQHSLLAASAAAVTGAFHPLFAAEKPGKSANDKLSVAVIGVRGRGQSHIRAFTNRSDCELTYICDADREVGEACAKKLGTKLAREPKFVEDMRRIFDDPTVDIVSVATPNHWHALAAIWAMQAGKDVYLEKPVSHNICEGRRLIQVSRKYNRICQAGTQKRSLAYNQEAARYVAAGKLGKIKLAHCYTYRLRQPIGPAGDYPVPPSVNYDLWAGPAPMGKVKRQQFHYDWHWFWDYGNGEIGNNSIHAVDTMRQILNLDGLGKSVLCYGGRVQFNDAGETANIQVAVHDFNGLTVVQEVRNLKTAAAPGTVVIVGTKGRMVCGAKSNTVYDLQGKVVAELSGAASESTEVTQSKGKHREDFGSLDDQHFANFLQAVRSRKRQEQIAEISQGVNSTALCHLGNISYRLGKPVAPAEIRDALGALQADPSVIETFDAVRKHLADNGVDIEKERLSLGPCLKIDSAAEKFIGNPAADALLTREYRKPFVVPTAEELGVDAAASEASMEGTIRGHKFPRRHRRLRLRRAH